MNGLPERPGVGTAGSKIFSTVTSSRSMGSHAHYRQTLALAASDLLPRVIPLPAGAYSQATQGLDMASKTS